MKTFTAEIICYGYVTEDEKRTITMYAEDETAARQLIKEKKKGYTILWIEEALSQEQPV